MRSRQVMFERVDIVVALLLELGVMRYLGSRCRSSHSRAFDDEHFLYWAEDTIDRARRLWYRQRKSWSSSSADGCLKLTT